MDRVISVPIHLGDLQADTQHLDATEFGAYMRLLFAHYHYGEQGLPDDDEKLARIARVSKAVWKRMAPTMRSYFKKTDKFLTQKRVKKELEKMEVRSQIARSNALKRNEVGEATAEPTLSQQGSKTPANDLLSINHKPASSKEEVITKKVKSRAKSQTTIQQRFGEDSRCPDDFANDASRNHGFSQARIDEAFTAFCNWHTAKGTTFADHRAGFRTWCSNQVTFAARSASKTGGGVRDNAAAAVGSVVSRRYGTSSTGGSVSGGDATGTTQTDLGGEDYGF